MVKFCSSDMCIDLLGTDLLDGAEGVLDVVDSCDVDVKVPALTARPLELDLGALVVPDVDGRLVDVDDALVQGVHETGGGLVGAGDGRGAGVPDEVFGFRDLPSGHRLEQLRHDLVRRTGHVLL